jgi:WD40 repeat protein
VIRNQVFQILSVVLLLLLNACSSPRPTVTTQAPHNPTATPALLEQQPAPTAPSPIPSTSQPPLPTSEITAGPRPIEPDNAGQLAVLSQLGKGTILAAPVFSPEGRLLAVPTAAGIYIYDADSRGELLRIPQGTAFITFSPDGSVLAASGLGAVSLWDPASGAPLGKLVGDPGSWQQELSFSPDGSLLAAANWNQEVLVWRVAGSKRLFTFPGDRLAFSPDGKLAAVITYGENQVQLYELSGGSKVERWSARDFGFAPDGQLWLDDGETVRLVYIERKLVTAPFRGVRPAFSADGGLMTLYESGQVWLYDPLKGRRVRQLEGSYTDFNQAIFSPDGQIVAGEVYSLHCPTCKGQDSQDRSLVLWRTADGTILAQIKHPAGWAAFSTNGGWLALTQRDSLQFYETAAGSLKKTIAGFYGRVAGMALSPDGRTLAAVDTNDPYTLRLWDLESGRVIQDLPGRIVVDAGANVAIAFSPDGKLLAVRGDLWDLATGQRLVELEKAVADRTSCWSSAAAFSPDGRVLATGCFEGQLDLWSARQFQWLQRIGDYSGWVDYLAFSPDGNALAAVYGVPDYRVQVWNLPEGQPAFHLSGEHFTRAVYSPDGKMLATVAANQDYEQYGWPAGFVELWDVPNGDKRTRLDVHDAVSLAFSSDGHILATGSLEGTLRLWETSSGRLLLETRQHYDSIQELAFTSDGTHLLTGSQDGTILNWGIPASLQPEGIDGWNTYTSEEFSFSISYPSGWSYLEIPNSDYESSIPQVWFSGDGFPPPQTDARPDIVLMILDKDPSTAWQRDYFNDYRSETIYLGSRKAVRVSGINKESLAEETAVITQIGARFLLALPNGSPESLAYFDRILSTLR